MQCPECEYEFKKCINPLRKCHYKQVYFNCLYRADACVSDEPSNKEIERIAAVQHEIWSHWMKYLLSQCEIGDGMRYYIPMGQEQRWKRQMNTPYAELTEEEKESDREQARKVINAD